MKNHSMPTAGGIMVPASDGQSMVPIFLEWSQAVAETVYPVAIQAASPKGPDLQRHLFVLPRGSKEFRQRSCEDAMATWPRAVADITEQALGKFILKEVSLPALWQACQAYPSIIQVMHVTLAPEQPSRIAGMDVRYYYPNPAEGERVSFIGQLGKHALQPK